MRSCRLTALWFVSVTSIAASAFGQPYGPPDRDAPGDEMIQKYLTAEAARLDGRGVLEGVKTLADWEKLRPTYRQQYLYMLGLWPLPEKTPLKATVTGTLQGDGYTVELLHYQSRPGLYVTGNLYRPAKIDAGKRLPTVFYVCGHSNQGRDGNKTAYQAHGIWFAKHGYICLTVDTLQLGEIGSIHHGTYREGRWWWHSRGYTPAGVECLNGIRGIDYLCGRPDVDPQRIAVTGISGGGAATFWIAAADERVKVAVPVSGMADLESYVGNRVINGHCDCMFLYNTFQWPWTRIAALIAPRAMLFTNSDADTIFPMDANDRIINRLERVYSLYGRSDYVDAMVSIGGHAYRKDLRQAAFRFINAHLKDDPRTVEDSEADLVTSEGKQKKYPIEPRRLRVFPQDSDIPKGELNTTIDRHFVPLAKVEVPEKGKFAEWQAGLKAELRRVVFRPLPERIPAAKLVEQDQDEIILETEPGIEINVLAQGGFVLPKKPERILLFVCRSDTGDLTCRKLLAPEAEKGSSFMYGCAPRGTDGARWTTKNPPNYAERSHVLLGRTVAAGQIWDVIATARYLKEKHGGKLPVYVAGEEAAAVLAAYAALLEPEIAGVLLDSPPLSHMDNAAPAVLNVLRVCDIPDVLGMLAPRPLTIYNGKKDSLGKVAKVYAAAGAAEKFVVKKQ